MDLSSIDAPGDAQTSKDLGSPGTYSALVEPYCNSDQAIKVEVEVQERATGGLMIGGGVSQKKLIMPVSAWIL